MENAPSNDRSTKVVFGLTAIMGRFKLSRSLSYLLLIYLYLNTLEHIAVCR
jgi:hypothetical protein